MTPNKAYGFNFGSGGERVLDQKSHRSLDES
jgi:hypothetical protein